MEVKGEALKLKRRRKKIRLKKPKRRKRSNKRLDPKRSL
jgi:hypothetical protein